MHPVVLHVAAGDQLVADITMNHPSGNEISEKIKKSLISCAILKVPFITIEA